MTVPVQIRLVRGPSPEGLRSLVSSFLNYHREIASASPASSREASRALRAWRTDRDRRFFVIRTSGEPVGFMVLKKDSAGPVFWGDQLYVEPSSRGRGLGRAAMRFAEDYVRKHGGDALYLNVAASNAWTLRLFQHMGYRTLNMVELRKDLRVRSIRRRSVRAGAVSMVRIWGVPLRVRRPSRTER